MGEQKRPGAVRHRAHSLKRVKGVEPSTFTLAISPEPRRKARNPTGFPIVYALSTHSQTALDEGVRALMGHVGQLLGKYGYVNESEHPWGGSRDYSDGRYGDYRYASGMAWPKELMDLAKEYQALYTQFISASKNLDGLNRQKAEAEAADIWNQA